jgi:hypothetical protein
VPSPLASAASCNIDCQSVPVPSSAQRDVARTFKSERDQLSVDPGFGHFHSWQSPHLLSPSIIGKPVCGTGRCCLCALEFAFASAPEFAFAFQRGFFPSRVILSAAKDPSPLLLLTSSRGRFIGRRISPRFFSLPLKIKLPHPRAHSPTPLRASAFLLPLREMFHAFESRLCLCLPHLPAVLLPSVSTGYFRLSLCYPRNK